MSSVVDVSSDLSRLGVLPVCRQHDHSLLRLLFPVPSVTGSDVTPAPPTRQQTALSCSSRVTKLRLWPTRVATWRTLAKHRLCDEWLMTLWWMMWWQQLENVQSNRRANLRLSLTRTFELLTWGLAQSQGLSWTISTDFGVDSSSSQAFLARDVIYTSRAYSTMSVSVCLWRKCIGSRYMPGRWEGSSRAILATARPCCLCGRPIQTNTQTTGDRNQAAGDDDSRPTSVWYDATGTCLARSAVARFLSKSRTHRQ